jgi:Mg2+ and Co2+ transporter CorA
VRGRFCMKLPLLIFIKRRVIFFGSYFGSKVGEIISTARICCMVEMPDMPRKDMRSLVDRIFSDDLMVGLAIILACSVVLPLFFEFSLGMQIIFEAVNYIVIAAFVAEYISKLYVAESRISFVIDLWHILDLLIIFIALLDISKLSIAPYAILEEGKLSPILRLLRVFIRVLLTITLAGRTAERIIPPQIIPEIIPQKSTLLISTLDSQGHCDKCSMKESSCSIENAGKTLWIDFQNISKIDLDLIEKASSIPKGVLESKLIRESFPRIDYVGDIPMILLWDSHINSTDPNGTDLEIITNDMLVVFKDNNIITLSTRKSDLFDKISAKSLPLEKEEFPDRIMYSLLQRKIDDYGEIVQRIERKTIGFEEIPIGRTSPQFLEETFHFKKEIQKIISNLWHFNQILHNLKENSDIFKKIDNHAYNLEILPAESDYMFETAKNTRESLISLIELHINTVSYDMNRVMKIIAVITCLALVPSIIGGLLGENILGQSFPITLTEVIFMVFSLMLLGVYTFYKMNWLR